MNIAGNWGSTEMTSFRLAMATVVVVRAGVLAVAVGSRLAFGKNETHAALYDLPGVTQPFEGSAINLVMGVLSRWDAVWYLLIANNGYDHASKVPTVDIAYQWGGSVNFSPLYPLAVHITSGFGASAETVVPAAYFVSFAALVVALAVFHRLCVREIGERAAFWATVLIAVFPGSLWFAIPYAESLLLCASVGAVYAARTSRWPLAGCLAAAATLTRPPGVLVLLPLGMLWVAERRARGEPILSPAAAWFLLGPLAVVAWFGYLWQLTGDPLAYLNVGERWYREPADPLTALAQSARAATDGLGAVISGGVSGLEMQDAVRDLVSFALVIAALVVAVAAFRGVGPAYGVYAIVFLLVSLSTGDPDHRAAWMLRYMAVIFPLFMELGRRIGDRKHQGIALAAVFSAGLAFCAAAFARWEFVA